MRKAFVLSLMICVMLLVSVSLTFAQGTIGVIPTELSFGKVDLGKSSDPQIVTIINMHISQIMKVSSITVTGDHPNDFSFVATTPFFLGPSKDKEVPVTFTPKAVGDRNAQLHIESTGGKADVALSGTGFLPPDIAVDPTSWNFGTVDIGDYKVANYADKTFVVSNVGGTVLNVTSVTLTGVDASQFSILSGGEPFSLNPGGTHDIKARFKPTTGGDKNANLTIVSDDPDESTLNVPLSGTGRVLDLKPPWIVDHAPKDGSILDIEPQNVQIVFNESMDTASVLKNSEFVRINITDDVTEMRASINTFLYWFGYDDVEHAAKYDGYGCQGPYGIAKPDMIDVTFMEKREILEIHLADLTIGQPNKPIGSGDTEYRLQILINGAKDDAGNTLKLTQVGYTYFLTQQEAVTTGAQTLTLLHDNSLTLNIPAGALSKDTTLTDYTYFYPTATLPAPLWAEFGKIGFVKAFHLELPGDVSITKPIGIRVKYNGSDIPAGAAEESLRLYQRDGNKWVFLLGSSVDMGNNIVSYDKGVTKLGDFAVMWGYPYGDVWPDGVINTSDILALTQDVAEFRRIFAPAPLPTPSDDLYMRNYVGNVHAGDEVINAQDTQEVIQVYMKVLDHFTILDTAAAPRQIVSHLPGTTKAFLSSDIFNRRVSIILDDATDVIVVEVELTYNPRLLKISEVSRTSLTSDSFMGYNDRNAGKLRLVLVNGLPLSSDGSLVDIQFELMPSANSAAAFDSIKLTKVELNAGLIKTTLEKLPQKLTLLQNYPNPFNPETWIPYELNQTADVEIRIYNINGQVVRQVSLGQQMPGSYITKDKAVYWDGTNDNGEKVSSGVYFYQLKAGEKSLVKKMVILK